MQQPTPSLEAVLSPKPTLDKRQVAESTATQFEQIFVQQMVKTMRSSGTTGDGEGLFGKDAGSSTYEDWFDMHLGRHLTESGGIGLARTLISDWERRGWIQPPESDAGKQSDTNHQTGAYRGELDVDS